MLEPPIIDNGSFVPRPSVITRGNKRVKIGTPVYMYQTYRARVDCKVVNETSPTTFKWFINGSPYYVYHHYVRDLSFMSTTTFHYWENNFECRAENLAGFTTFNSTVYLSPCKYVCHNIMCILII